MVCKFRKKNKTRTVYSNMTNHVVINNLNVSYLKRDIGQVQENVVNFIYIYGNYN